MEPKKSNVRTTIAGGLTILGGVLTFVGVWLSTGHIPDGAAWGILGTAITMGAGLIAAADAKKHEDPHE